MKLFPASFTASRKMLPTPRVAWLLAALALLSACESIPRKERDAAERARYHEYAGAPVESFTWLGRYDGWTAIDKYEVVVWTSINDAYLITVLPPCEDLTFANHIGLTQTLHTVSQRFDYVKTRNWKCQIKEIRPVNYLKMKQDARAKSEADKAKAAEQKP